MKRKYLWLVFAAFVIITILRETGLVRINTYNKEFTALQMHTGWTKTDNKDKLVNAADKKPLRSNERTPLLEEMVQQKIISSGLPEGYVLSDFQVALRGSYWVPLRKTAECRYSLKFTRELSRNQKEYYFIIGTLNLKINGFCSIWDYQNEAARQVARLSHQIILQPSPSLKKQK
jgi:hypothetical protein